MGNCSSLAALPESLGQLQALTTLYLEGCTSLAVLPESLGQLQAADDAQPVRLLLPRGRVEGSGQAPPAVQ